MMNKKSIFRNLRLYLKKHSPEVLMGFGIAGMITTTVMAVKATPKALTLIEKEKSNSEIELSHTETIKIAWKCYIPSAAIGCVSICCLIGASSVNFKRNAALATAYSLSNSTLKEYQEKVVEIMGKDKEKTVRDAIAKDKIDNNPMNTQEIILTEKGTQLCFDPLSGRYFRSDINQIKKAANNLSRIMLDDLYVSLNDFYYEIGLDETKIGETLGWHIDDGLIDLDFSAQLSPDDTPCLVIDYVIAPTYEYKNRFWQ